MLNSTFKKYFQKQLLVKAKSINPKLQYDITYNQKTVVPYNAQDFFQVVYEVEKYHYFLPWCSSAVIHKRKGFSYFEAELFINFKVYQDSYISKVSSEVTQNNYKIISLSNNISAFKELKSTWNIKPLTDKTCLIDYDIDFEFKNFLYQTVAQMFLDNVIKKINQSFEGRVQDLMRQNFFEQNKLQVFKNMEKEQEQSSQKSEQFVHQQTIVNQNDKGEKNVSSTQNFDILKEISNQQSVSENKQESNQIANKYQINHNQQNILSDQELKQQIEDHINQLVLQKIAKEEEAKVFMKSLLKNPEQQELIVNAYKFFILNKGLINMNEEQANWKFLSFLRSTTLYR